MKFINLLTLKCVLCICILPLCSCQSDIEITQSITVNNSTDVSLANSPGTSTSQTLTAKEVIELIKKNVNCPWDNNKTVDTIKAGSPETIVTGITTTGFATMEVLRKAAASGHNLVITHEPTFYNHYDKLQRLTGDFVQESKKSFIEQNNLVVWRFHDHWHRHEPDGIYTGMIETLGLKEFAVEGEKRIFQIPETTAYKLAQDLKEILNAGSIRGVGNPKQKVKRIGLVLGSPSSMNHFKMFQRGDIDLVVAGENPEWETTEYVRDAVSLGKKQGLLLIGHNNSEEGGMKYCKEWLKVFLPQMPIEFIASGDPFWSLGN